jgi:hypothetical protein
VRIQIWLEINDLGGREIEFWQEDGDRITRLLGLKASCYSKKFNIPQTPRMLSIVSID